jgi:hypothetical protein
MSGNLSVLSPGEGRGFFVMVEQKQQLESWVEITERSF